MTNPIKKWIVTGYSTDLDGLLYYVEAESEEAAVRKVGTTINDIEFRSVEIDGNTKMILNINDNVITDSEIVERLCDWEYRSFWEMFAQEMKADLNMGEAVCW